MSFLSLRDDAYVRGGNTPTSHLKHDENRSPTSDEDQSEYGLYLHV